MATTPLYGWRIPDLGTVTDGPVAFGNLATDMENTLKTPTTFTPSLTTDAGGFANPSGTKVGRYAVRNGWCSFTAYISIGASPTIGATGSPFRVGLPVLPDAASPGEQWLWATIWDSFTAWWPALVYVDTALISSVYRAGMPDSYAKVWTNDDFIQPACYIAYGGRYRVA